MTLRQLGRLARDLRTLAQNAESNGAYVAAAKFLEAEALVHASAGALNLAHLVVDEAEAMAKRATSGVK